MRLREIDAGGWLRATGAALFGGCMATAFSMRFTAETRVVVTVGAVVAIAVLVLVVSAWSSGGGPAERRALRAWVQGGPEPDGVRRDRKARFLRDFVDRTGWYLWFGAALGGRLRGGRCL